MPVTPVKGVEAEASGRMPSFFAGMVIEPWIGSIDQSRAKPSQEEINRNIGIRVSKPRNPEVRRCHCL